MCPPRAHTRGAPPAALSADSDRAMVQVAERQTAAPVGLRSYRLVCAPWRARRGADSNARAGRVERERPSRASSI